MSFELTRTPHYTREAPSFISGDESDGEDELTAESKRVVKDSADLPSDDIPSRRLQRYHTLQCSYYLVENGTKKKKDIVFSVPKQTPENDWISEEQGVHCWCLVTQLNELHKKLQGISDREMEELQDSFSRLRQSNSNISVQGLVWPKGEIKELDRHRTFRLSYWNENSEQMVTFSVPETAPEEEWMDEGLISTCRNLVGQLDKAYQEKRGRIDVQEIAKALHKFQRENPTISIEGFILPDLKKSQPPLHRAVSIPRPQAPSPPNLARS